MNKSVDYVNAMFADVVYGVRKAWDAGQMVPCEACDDGGVYILDGNTYRVETCLKCDGTGYVMGAKNDE